jgi:YHS domain-containing protein
MYIRRKFATTPVQFICDKGASLFDCSINAQLQGRTYCFGSKEAMAEFMKNPTENLAKAQAYYSKKHPG